MSDLQASIDDLWARRDDLGPGDDDARRIVHEAVDLLDSGAARVAEWDGEGAVTVNEWLKRAVLLLFRVQGMETIELGPFEYADKLPLKSDYEAKGVRVVPGASARWGSFLDRGVVMMPSYVNIGAHVASGSMVDTWATVGSCAQIGRNVHLSGGVGIGGVLEPVQAAPVMIGDECYIGSRCIVAEGATVGTGTVLGAGSILTASVPGDRRRERRRDQPGPRPRLVRGRHRHPAESVRRRHVRPALRAGHQAPDRRRAPRQGRPERHPP